jgi:hypothetical protein
MRRKAQSFMPRGEALPLQVVTIKTRNVAIELLARFSRDEGLSLEGSREPIGIAFTPYLSIGDDIETGLLLRPDRQDRRVILGFGQERLGNAPQIVGTHTRGKRSARSINHSGWG